MYSPPSIFIYFIWTMWIFFWPLEVNWSDGKRWLLSVGKHKDISSSWLRTPISLPSKAGNGRWRLRKLFLKHFGESRNIHINKTFHCSSKQFVNSHRLFWADVPPNEEPPVLKKQSMLAYSLGIPVPHDRYSKKNPWVRSPQFNAAPPGNQWNQQDDDSPIRRSEVHQWNTVGERVLQHKTSSG